MNARERLFSDRDALESRVGAWLQGESRCALLGYPNHWNAGDCVLWASTCRLLDRLRVEVRYTCDPVTYHPGALRRRLPEGPLLLSGGGNFGDVYQNEVGLRARALSDFPERRILQLPQSLWFRRPESLQEWTDRLSALADFTLLVRDLPSLRMAQTFFPVPSLLCPDASAWLGDVPVVRRPVCDVLILWREDSESPGPPPTRAHGLSLEVQDWTHSLAGPGDPLSLQWLALWNRIRERLIVRRPALTRRWDALFPEAAEAVVRERVRNALRQLARGRVVITNRLHAALLCRMQGWPHVVCDNAIGKLGAYADTWPISEDSMRTAGSPEEALEAARDLLRAGVRPPVTP